LIALYLSASGCAWLEDALTDHSRTETTVWLDLFDPLRGPWLLLQAPAEWTLQEREWFEGATFELTFQRSPCNGSIEVDFYGGFGAGACGLGPALTPELSSGAFLGQEIVWRTGRIPTRCGEMWWRRALAGAIGGGLTITAPTRGELETLTRMVERSRQIGPPLPEPLRATGHEERWRYSTRFCR
jgi:hypothetical protein